MKHDFLKIKQSKHMVCGSMTESSFHTLGTLTNFQMVFNKLFFFIDELLLFRIILYLNKVLQIILTITSITNYYKKKSY